MISEWSGNSISTNDQGGGFRKRKQRSEELSNSDEHS